MQNKTEKRYWVYRVLNLVNGKYYIGRTTCKTGVNGRWCVHKLHATRDYDTIRKTYFTKVLQEYGADNFEVKAICEVKSFDEMVAIENFYIRYYNSSNPKYGYNICEFRSDGTRIMDEVSSDKMSRATRLHRLNSSLKAENGLNKNYSNVCYSNSDGKHSKNPWVLRIKKGDSIYIKRFSNAQLAGEAADKLSIFLYGNNFKLNFPEKLDFYLSCDLKAHAESVAYRPPTTSKYINVTKQAGNDKWMARAHIKTNVRLLLGFFNTEEDAAIAHDKIEFLLRGENSKKINFPEKLKDYDLEEISRYYNNLLTTNKQRNRITSSKYRGVSRSNNLWSYEFRYNSKRYRGTAPTEEDAAKQYDLLAIEHLKERAKINFPRNNYEDNIKSVNKEKQ